MPRTSAHDVYIYIQEGEGGRKEVGSRTRHKIHSHLACKMSSFQKRIGTPPAKVGGCNAPGGHCPSWPFQNAKGAKGNGMKYTCVKIYI